MSGKPVYVYDEANPDWLPTLHLGHSKKQSNKQGVETWARKQAREQSVKEAESEAAEALLTLCDNPTVEPVETGVATQTELTSTKVQDTHDRSREIIDDLTLRLIQQVAPYTKESLTSDHIVKFYTGLPNKKVLKAVFNLVKRSVQGCENSKLTWHQEFMATVMKLRLNCQIQDLAFCFNVLLFHVYF